MKISPGIAKYFYQTSKLTTVIGNDQKRSMLRIEGKGSIIPTFQAST